MKLRDLPGKVDRTQKSRWFKVAATTGLLLVLAGWFAWYAIGVQNGTFAGSESVLESLRGDPSLSPDDPRVQLISGVLADSSVVATAGIGALIVAAVGAIIIWLGLGLTYLLIGVVAGLVAAPLLAFDQTAVYGWLALGVLVLAASFTALLQGARLAVSGPGPVLGVARNMLTEAVRMKISLVLIVLLILGLAALPGLLNDAQPLRYRVQSFFQYSVSGTFWILAFLTLAFGIASVTAEQREKTIWQTVTKPVAAWEYLLGKWLGLVTLNAVLLGVSATGIFLFADYLRNQPAIGETRAYQSEGGGISEDRMILETRVMAARRSIGIVYPDEMAFDSDEFRERVRQYIETERKIDPEFARSASDYQRVVGELHESVLRGYRSIAPGDSRLYRFEGLGEASRQDGPLTLRVRFDAEGNRPDVFYNMTFALPYSQDPTPMYKKVSLGFFHNIPLTPQSVGDDGVLEVAIMNGSLVDMGAQGLGVAPNSATVSIPADALEISYRSGSYRANFARVVLVLWVKLAFLSMLAVWASTFLSFPVACMVAFGVFLLAEMSGFLVNAVEYFDTSDRDGNAIWYKVIVATITNTAAGAFTVYNDLRPVNRLVEGRLLSWGSVSVGTAVLLVGTGVLYGLSILIFRRRELAIYSGN